MAGKISLELTEEEIWLLWRLLTAEQQKAETPAGFGVMVPATEQQPIGRPSDDIPNLCMSIHRKLKEAAQSAN
jgi:hypothetical protein